MSGPAQSLRLQILLESAALSRVLDRLCVLGIVPRVLTLRRDETGRGELRVELDLLSPQLSESLIARLGQIPAVVSVALDDDEPGLKLQKDANDSL